MSFEVSVVLSILVSLLGYAVGVFAVWCELGAITHELRELNRALGPALKPLVIRPAPPRPEEFGE